MVGLDVWFWFWWDSVGVGDGSCALVVCEEVVRKIVSSSGDKHAVYAGISYF